MTVRAWLRQPSRRWAHLRKIPLRQLWVLLLAIFLLFSMIGFYIDLMDSGTRPYAVVLIQSAFSGLNAVSWVLVLARLPLMFALPLAGLQFFSNSLNVSLAHLVTTTFHLAPVDPTQGIHFAAIATLVVVLASYGCFVTYIRTIGRESLRLRTELDLAHSIQKTLVPTIFRQTQAFEIYGISKPSEQVGGDLVDAVDLQDGDTVAYLADIAGHGLQAGILMGMLKTAARTALLESIAGEQGATLCRLMERLNQVLPGVKEPHMYATFTALRLNCNGDSFYGMAANPPLLLWSASTRMVSRIEEQQFPLALLPVTGFAAHPLAMQPGDLALLATDGILEVCSPNTEEFGAASLEQLLLAEAERPLAELAALILDAVHAYGRQQDDQTLLLVRRRTHPSSGAGLQHARRSLVNAESGIS